MDLKSLSALAREELSQLNFPPANWVPATEGPDGRPLVDALIVGGGMCGQTATFALLRALWAEERDTSDAAVRISIAKENGLPGEELQREETSPRVQALYRTYSEEAEHLGVFGAPTYVLEGERFWGQDRLDFLDCALAQRSL